MRRNVDHFGAGNAAQCGAMWINPAAAQGRGMANPDPEHTEDGICHIKRTKSDLRGTYCQDIWYLAYLADES